VVPADRKVFISPLEGGLRVAGTVELAGLDAPPTEARARLLHRDLLAAFPGARTDAPQPFWMGHRPCLPDSMPVMGPVAAWGGLHACFGHGHLGLTASARAGEILARMIAGAPVEEDMTPFAIERFRGGV
jgi:D-amino-acid dehydrogenase